MNCPIINSFLTYNKWFRSLIRGLMTYNMLSCICQVFIQNLTVTNGESCIAIGVKKIYYFRLSLPFNLAQGVLF